MTDFRNTRIGVQLVLFGSRVVVLEAHDQVIKYLLLLLLIMVYKAAPFMLNVKINWFFLKINIIVMRKLGVFSCDEPDSERNKILGKVTLFVQKCGKPKISERLNSNTATKITSLKVIKFY